MARIARRSGVAAAAIVIAISGCCTPDCPPPPGYATSPAAPAAPAVANHPNPVFIPIADPQCAWERVVESVNDYFRYCRVEHEEPPRVVGNVAIAGTLTTIPEVSPTVLEPWRRDTVDPDQRVENTLQTMRRQVVVHATTVQGGHWVDVSVFKYLENLLQPENATAGSATFRYDNSLVHIVNPVTSDTVTVGWIRQGRDASLEQAIIDDLLSRCGQPGSPVVMRGQSSDSGK